MTVRTGISGWVYPPWRGVFYPPGLAQKNELAYASSQLSSIEINGSFYALQKPTSYARWHDETPEDFVFSLKAPRYITHMLKLTGAEVALANFWASGVLALGAKLGPVLWQVPPTTRFDPGVLSAFFDQLPRTTGEAAVHARAHEARLDGRALTETSDDRPLRHVLEVRHASFETPSLVDLLRAHDVGLVCADTAGLAPMLDDVTSDMVYVRLHGHDELYTSGYDAPAIARWAAKVRTWAAGGTPTDGKTLAPPAAATERDVFVYFDNDAKVRAPFDAQALAQALRTS